ncbi:hypothetical protein CI610_02728 [invertebrate metagenome]|uniref:Uncharacterized protein n=1 Tax=invertebrate metagenome TaxID=1711999 RepID=A0A2H9T551_9ZZZZ
MCNIADYSDNNKNTKYNNIILTILDIEREILNRNPTARVLFGTIPPKDLQNSIRKYPHKSCLTPSAVCVRYQKQFEDFVMKLNTFICNFNNTHTRSHLALHTDLRIHRSRGRISQFFLL